MTIGSKKKNKKNREKESGHVFSHNHTIYFLFIILKIIKTSAKTTQKKKKRRTEEPTWDFQKQTYCRTEKLWSKIELRLKVEMSIKHRPHYGREASRIHKSFPFRKNCQKHTGRHMTSMRRNKAASTILRRHVPPGIKVHQRTSGKNKIKTHLNLNEILHQRTSGKNKIKTRLYLNDIFHLAIC